MNIKPVALVVIVLGSGLAGYYLSPQKIKIEKEIVTKEVEKTDITKQINTDLDRNKRKETTITKTTKPDGTIEETTKTVEDTNTNKTTNSNMDKTIAKEKDVKESETKLVESKGGVMSISALGAVKMNDLSNFKLDYGIHAQRSIIGPISAGAFVFMSGTAGVSVGIMF